jgi:signal transduction histidine kinase
MNIYAYSVKNILFISSYSPNFISFNNQLKRLSYNTYEVHKDFIVAMFFTIISLILIIFALILHNMKTLKYKNELHQAKKIVEDANIAKNNFIANISHELRTPLTVITSANQLLKILLSNENINNCQGINNNLNIITQNCNRLLRLINNIIDIAKIDSGFTDLKLQTTDIIKLIEDAVLSVIPYANSKNLNIVFDTNIEELLMSTDCEKIERIVLNLFSNAIKFSNPGGDIFATIIADKNNLDFIVQDNGIGIDEENLSKIFDKFMQIDNGLTRQNEGSGIGLSVVKSFVKLHDGTINVDSKLGKGTSFIITLPIKANLTNHIYNEISSTNKSTNIELSDIFK